MSTSQDILVQIDQIALEFARTKHKKLFDEFAVHAIPLIKGFAQRTCAGASWDSDDLFSILLTDMWRLFNSYCPTDQPFHYLMLRQLKNKSINFVNNQTRALVVCRVCGTTNEKGCKVCDECRTSLSALPPCIHSDLIGPNIFDHIIDDKKSILDQIASNDFVEKLLDRVSDTTTKQILVMVAAGESKSTIREKIKLAPNAITHRIIKCRKIVKKLREENI